MEEIKRVLEKNRLSTEDININVEPVDLTGITTAEIETYYPEIKEKWEYGVNTVNEKGEIIARSYTELQFPNTEAQIEEIDLGYYDEEFEGRHFYRVLSPFLEKAYNLLDIKDYREWQYSVSSFYKEQYFNNENPEIEEKEIDISILTSRTRGTTRGIPNKYTLPNNLPTGGYIIEQKFETGKALGIKFECNVPFDLYIGKKEKDSEPSEKDITSTIKYSPLINEEIFSICIRPSVNVPIVSIKAYLWGTKEKYKAYLLNGEIEDKEEVLLHPLDENIDVKLKPPGKSHFLDNFWNMRDSSNLPIIKDIFNRLNKQYGFKN